MDRNVYSQEWFKQAEYDIETAEVLFNNTRYIYCIFMCHLALEKAIKALYVKRAGKIPQRTHSLVYLAKSVNLIFPNDRAKEFLESLDDISVPTRYPQELETLIKEYDMKRTETIFVESKRILEWLRKE